AVVSTEPAVMAAVAAVMAAVPTMPGLGRGGRNRQDAADGQDAQRHSQCPSHRCTFLTREPKLEVQGGIPSTVLALLRRSIRIRGPTGQAVAIIFHFVGFIAEIPGKNIDVPRLTAWYGDEPHT